MIRGVVTLEREPVVRLRVIGPTQAQEFVDALVDTGYTGSLSLPANVIANLHLIRSRSSPVTLADGSQIMTDVYEALIEWDGAIRNVTVSALGPDAVIGMGLLDDHELRVEAVVGGAVEIRPLVAPAP